ncbi:MAG: nucleotidyltransferase family protein [Planctomycetota bacterium]
MMRAQVLDILAAHRPQLGTLGVKSLALFGSVARDEATDASDVDLLVEFDRPVSLFEVLDVRFYLERLLGVREVDLVLRRAVLDELKEDIYGEAVDAF